MSIWAKTLGVVLCCGMLLGSVGCGSTEETDAPQQELAATLQTELAAEAPEAAPAPEQDPVAVPEPEGTASPAEPVQTSGAVAPGAAAEGVTTTAAQSAGTAATGATVTGVTAVVPGVQQQTVPPYSVSIETHQTTKAAAGATTTAQPQQTTQQNRITTPPAAAAQPPESVDGKTQDEWIATAQEKLFDAGEIAFRYLCSGSAYTYTMNFSDSVDFKYFRTVYATIETATKPYYEVFSRKYHEDDFAESLMIHEGAVYALRASRGMDLTYLSSTVTAVKEMTDTEITFLVRDEYEDHVVERELSLVLEDGTWKVGRYELPY